MAIQSDCQAKLYRVVGAKPDIKVHKYTHIEQAETAT